MSTQSVQSRHFSRQDERLVAGEFVIRRNDWN